MTLSDLISDIDFLAGTNTAKYPTADKVRNINLRYSEAVALILKSDGRWQWDDSNQLDSGTPTTPIGTQNLSEGVQNYEIAGATYITVSSVQVKDKNGNYQVTTPVDYTDDPQELARLSALTGMPQFHMKRGDSIFLFPKPTSTYVTLSSGLRVFFQRPPLYFQTSETSKEPGFNPLFHRILSVGAALDYAFANGVSKKIQYLTPLLNELKTGLIDAYTRRSRDEQPCLTLASDNEIY